MNINPVLIIGVVAFCVNLVLIAPAFNQYKYMRDYKCVFPENEPYRRIAERNWLIVIYIHIFAIVFAVISVVASLLVV